MKSIFSLFIATFLWAASLSAQPYPAIDIPFTVDGKLLAFPLAGGLNNPQISQADLNGDGLPDLYVFDRTGGTHLVFINQGDDYRYAPEYADRFPQELNDWVLIRDFNGDGVPDLFTQAQRTEFVQGIIVFQGRMDNGRIAFERMSFDHPRNIIPFTLSNGTKTQVYVSNVDYPAIDDIDCDGDLDLLTFSPSGGYIEFYANRSVELGYGRDSIILELVDDCWGGVFEGSVAQELGLADSPGDCFNAFGQIEERHPGSTLLSFDATGNGVKDLILGHVTYPTLNFLTNSGDCEQAWVSEQQINFPADGVPVELPLFPVSFLADVNFDGKRDLLVAPNSVNISEDREVVWLYENAGTADVPDFRFQQRDFLVGDMVDLGTGASPTFVDYNADGLLDLVVGNVGAYLPFGERDTRLFLFENVGTAESPAFELVDDDYLGLSAFSTFTSFAPTFGDLDGDGDLDVLVGEVLGQLFYAENIAGPGNPMVFGPWQYDYMGIDVGSVSVPCIVDLDRDGLPDLLVGERTGNINFFKNIGTATEPMFNPDPEAMPNKLALGNINAAVPGSITGHSVPVVLDQNGTFLLFVGTEAGQIEVYKGIEDNIYGTFQQDAERMGGLRVGARTRPAFADLNNDGRLEVIVGNQRGGLNAYRTNLGPDSTTPSTAAAALPALSIWPNPASEALQLSWPGASGGFHLTLYDAQGQNVLQAVSDGPDYRLGVQQLPAGLYFLRASGQGGQVTQKVILTGR